ncbi:hypothetical protein V1J52_05845 [Streptomyces sp. TRM 70351]|uniref:hypothetical protein n=1 Tax=Streptomyces sp. TRM 70351 TaxID=3116552 RepID=UPI002E7BFC09|nr:hypothetical protein [Streptomyces sp. TRM 70351]MEE1927717.1 hypothetical protein [Streptomyces sp. TRM 70351]
MESTRRVAPAQAYAPAPSAAHRGVEGYLMAAFPWYGLDEAFSGPRWLMQVGAAADGTVEHGATGHGEEPSMRTETEPDEQRFTVVVTVASRPPRQSADGTGMLEATSVSSAAWLAGSGLLSRTWPTHMERALRQEWLDQQTAVAWDLADQLGDGAAEGWTALTLPVDGVPTPFHYRESAYGWVLAGTAPEDVHIGAYGRGMSAYGLGFSVVKDITGYAAPAAGGR